MSEKRKEGDAVLKELPSWTAFIVTIAASVAGSTAFAYSTFVTIRERDLIKTGYDAHLMTLDNAVSSIAAGQSEMKGKIDSMFLLMQNQGQGKH